tara:strand:- start:33 stop:248 length:216 start_codon:yes stop_codon:yes gene_type:complete
MSHHTPIHKAKNWFLSRANEASTLGGIAIICLSLSVIFGFSVLAWIGLGIAAASILQSDGKCQKCNKGKKK